MTTNICQFSVESRKIDNKGIRHYGLSTFARCHDFYEFELDYWLNYNFGELEMKIDFKASLITIYNTDGEQQPFLPFIYFLNANNCECIGTYLFKHCPVILEFNGSWIRMYSCKDYDDSIESYVNAFTDKSNIELKESVKACIAKLNVDMAVEIALTPDGYGNLLKETPCYY